MSGYEPEVVVYGTGAIGATVGAWLLAAEIPTVFVARPDAARRLNEQGLKVYPQEGRVHTPAIPVVAVSNVSERSETPIIVLAVKNYDLEAAAQDIRTKVRPDIILVALQNGIENQAILPKYFQRVVYGVVLYNAWQDAPNVFGYARRGPILLGMAKHASTADRDRVVGLFSSAFECHAEERIEDAAKSKMLLNLLTTTLAVVGVGLRQVEDYDALGKTVLHVMYEGIQILRKSGVDEVRFELAPSWKKIWALKVLPDLIARQVLRRNLRTLPMTSMAQDAYQKRRHATELESLNGYFVKLAESIGFKAPYNSALYQIMKEWLAQSEIRPLHERDLWTRLRATASSK